MGIQMMKATVLLMLIALVLWACANSPHVSQDMFLSEHGFAALSRSDYSEAEAYLLVALDINPNNPYTLLNLGVVFQYTGRTKEAVEMYQKVLELNPEETVVQSNREGYSGKKITDIARENLKSLGVFIAQKGPGLNTMGLVHSADGSSSDGDSGTASSGHGGGHGGGSSGGNGNGGGNS